MFFPSYFVHLATQPAHLVPFQVSGRRSFTNLYLRWYRWMEDAAITDKSCAKDSSRKRHLGSLYGNYLIAFTCDKKVK